MKLDWALFRFPFDDPRWKNKALIGGAMVFAATAVSFPFFFLHLPVMGYGLRIMKRTAHGEAPSLPEWDQWGELFLDGLKQLAVYFVYTLPLSLIIGCLYGVVMAGIFGTAALSEAADSQTFAGTFGVTMAAVFATIFLMTAVFMVIGIPLIYLAAVATSRMAATGELSSAFEFREVLALARAGFKHYIIAVIAVAAVSYVGTFAASLLIYTLCLSCLYPFAAAASAMYTTTMVGAAFGQAYYHVTSTSDKAKVGEQSALPGNTDQPATAKPATNPGKKTGPRKKVDPDA
jgi:uncharacterized protein DUF4013